MIHSLKGILVDYNLAGFNKSAPKFSGCNVELCVVTFYIK